MPAEFEVQNSQSVAGLTKGASGHDRRDVSNASPGHRMSVRSIKENEVIDETQYGTDDDYDDIETNKGDIDGVRLDL